MELFAGEVGLVELIVGLLLAWVGSAVGGMLGAQYLYGKDLGQDMAGFMGRALGPAGVVPGLGLVLFVALFI